MSKLKNILEESLIVIDDLETLAKPNLAPEMSKFVQSVKENIEDILDDVDATNFEKSDLMVPLCFATLEQIMDELIKRRSSCAIAMSDISSEQPNGSAIVVTKGEAFVLFQLIHCILGNIVNSHPDKKKRSKES